MATSTAFILFTINGVDAQKFLHGQVTLNTEALAENQTRYTAICSLKGRIQFGLWLKKINSERFEIVTTQDQAEEVAKHIKQFGAFSKIKLEEVGTVYPTLHGEHTDFSPAEADLALRKQHATRAGQAWIEAYIAG